MEQKDNFRRVEGISGTIYIAIPAVEDKTPDGLGTANKLGEASPTSTLTPETKLNIGLLEP